MNECRQANHPSHFLSEAHKHFEIVEVKTPLLLTQAFKLRYQLYCVDNAFESAQDFPAQLEYDQWDKISHHLLLFERATAAAVGYVRLINSPTGSVKDLPLYQACSLLDEKGSMYRTAEISRFLLMKQKNNRAYPPLRYAAYGMFTLLQAILNVAVKNNITDLCGLLDTRLLKICKRISIFFEEWGPVINFHGLRQPSRIKTAALKNYFNEYDDEQEKVVL